LSRVEDISNVPPREAVSGKAPENDRKSGGNERTISRTEGKPKKSEGSKKGTHPYVVCTLLGENGRVRKSALDGEPKVLRFLAREKFQPNPKFREVKED